MRRFTVAVIVTATAASGLVVATPGAGAAAADRPAISRVLPASGSTTGGTTVKIRGTAFAHVSQVLFGTVAGTGVHVDSATELTVHAPQHVTGRVTVRVVVATKGASSESAHSKVDLFTYYTPKPVTAVSSTSTPASVTLRWSVPAHLRGVTIRRLAGATAPSRRGQGVLVAHVKPTITSYTDLHLTSGAEYSYALFTREDQALFAPAVSLTAQTLTRAEADHSWSGPGRPFPFPHGGPVSVSCVSPRFCQAIDIWGFVFTYNGSTWTKTGHVGLHRNGGFAYVVCLSRTWCLAAVQTTEVYRYDGKRWTAMARIAGGTVSNGDSVLSLACASTSFCVAGMEDGLVATYDGKSWSRAKQIDPGPPDYDGPSLFSTSCVSARFCAVGDDSGQVLTYDGRSWSKPTSITGSANTVSGVSCVSATYCLAATGVSVSRYNGRAWTTLHHRPKRFAPASVDCRSKSFCLVLDGKHYSSSVFNGTSFAAVKSVQTTQPDQPSLTPPGVGSCASVRFCVALVEDGASVSTGGTWSTPDRFDPLGGGLSEISCIAGGFCLAADSVGHTRTYQSGTWKEAGATGSELVSLSCVSSTFCAAVTFNGAQVFNGSSWSRARLTGFEDLQFVSCTAPTFCLAIDGLGNTASYNGSKWVAEPSPKIEDNYLVTGLSCVVPSTCVLVGSNEGSSVYEIFHGSKWAKPVRFGSGNFDGAVRPSCAGTTCIAAGGDAGVYSYNGTRWAQPTDLGMAVQGGSCGSPTFCVAFGDTKVSFFDGTTWSTPSPVSATAISLQAVSCTSDNFCLVDNHDRDTYTSG